MRLKNVPYAKDKLSKYPDIVIMDRKNKGNYQKLFNNDNPIHLELGMGKGNFIIGMAKKYPNINFIGIEKYDSVLVRALEKIIDNEEVNLPNLKLMREDASELLDIFSPNEISHIYLNFSDPWPKKRHQERRLTSKRFMAIYEIILKDEKNITLKTDNRKLFEFSLLVFNELNYEFKLISLDLHKDLEIENIYTEYEEKFKDSPIYYVDITKIK